MSCECIQHILDKSKSSPFEEIKRYPCGTEKEPWANEHYESLILYKCRTCGNLFLRGWYTSDSSIPDGDKSYTSWVYMESVESADAVAEKTSGYTLARYPAEIGSVYHKDQYEEFGHSCVETVGFELFETVKGEIESSRLDEAIIYASKAHAGAFRKGTDIPYIVHPMEVFKIVCGLTEDEDVRIAAILHDTVEDTGTTIDEIRCIFGEKVARLVGSESENKREGTPEQDTWKLRKGETIERLKSASKEIRTIAMGDKLANLRDITRDYRALGENLWERFNAPGDKKESIGWYYRSVLEALKPDFEHTPEYEEYSSLLNFTFGL